MGTIGHELTPPIPAAHPWRTNGHLIADVLAVHGRPGDIVLDPTYGRGTWWTQHRPAHLIAHDLSTDGIDFRHLSEADHSVDIVAFDPPYKLNGTPTPEVDQRYGAHVVATWQERHQLIRDGMTEAARVTRRLLLLKCQDQVCSGQIRWQSDDFTAHALTLGLVKIDRFTMLGTARRQPMNGRAQRHAHGQPSVLLVFRRP